ncbi:MAG: dipeptidase [Planctomycetota bacterium]
MLFFDAHLDLAWNGVDWNRDLKLEVADIREREKALNLKGKARGANTVSYPALRRGGVGLGIATLLARLHRSDQAPGFQVQGFNRYEDMAGAFGSARGQLAYYEALQEEGVLRLISTKGQLAEMARAWNGGVATAETPLGFILSMEGADPIIHPRQVESWWKWGLRVVGPAHYGISTYSHGTATPGGLMPLGPELLSEMRRVGMVLDVTHLADQAFDEALDKYDGPVLASHHNCRALVPDQRQLTDDQIRRLIQRGAVIGAAFDAWMLVPRWVRGKTTVEETGVALRHVADHIDHVCQVAGNCRHAALGTDLDGGFGAEQSPGDIETIADLPKLVSILKSRGYSVADIEQIAHGNWIRFFGEHLPD